MEEIMDAQTSNEFSIAYLKRSIAAQEERIIAGLMKGVDTVEMEDRLQGGPCSPSPHSERIEQ